MKAKSLAQIIAAAAAIFIGWPAELALAGGAVTLPGYIVVPPPQSRPSTLPAGERQTEASTLATCTNCRIPIPPSRPREIARTPSAPPALNYYPLKISFRTRGKSIGAACRSQFMNTDGQYGPVGRKIAGLISSDDYKGRFLNGSSLRAVCPRYSRLSVDQQAKAWVWFWMVLANEESTCNSNLRHATHFPDGRVLNPKPGHGLFAAETYPQHRNWRGRMCQGNIRTSDVQVNCAVHTMATTQLSRGRGVLWSGSYWGPVRRAGRQIMPNMRGFKSCF